MTEPVSGVDGVAEVRRQFALDLGRQLELRSSDLVRAFAAVPRERFVGAGPWLVSDGDGYRRTPDADPTRLYADVRVALDPARELNSGRPFLHARWLDRLGVGRGDRVLHVGGGTGYYTSILAEIVGADGAVLAAELDPGLRARLRQNTAALPHVQIVEPRGVEIEFGSVDRIYVNCALTRPPEEWLRGLRPGGTMVLPLTEMGSSRRHGGVFWIQRRDGAGYAAEFIDHIRMFPCEGGRHPCDEPVIAAAFERGGEEQVRSLVCSVHPPEKDCWLHAESFCLSRRPPPTGRRAPQD